MQMDHPPTNLEQYQKRNITYFGLGYHKVKLQKGNPTQTLPKIIRRFHMYYIAIDVSKKALSVFDGKKYLKNK